MDGKTKSALIFPHKLFAKSKVQMIFEEVIFFDHQKNLILENWKYFQKKWKNIFDEIFLKIPKKINIPKNFENFEISKINIFENFETLKNLKIPDRNFQIFTENIFKKMKIFFNFLKLNFFDDQKK